jgi:hypothetical protein
MRETRKAEYQPYLRVFLFMGEVMAVFLRFANIGRAAACDLQFRIQFKKEGETVEERTYHEDTMLPLADRDLITPESYFKTILSKLTTITISGSYTNGFGETTNLSH